MPVGVIIVYSGERQVGEFTQLKMTKVSRKAGGKTTIVNILKLMRHKKQDNTTFTN